MQKKALSDRDSISFYSTSDIEKFCYRKKMGFLRCLLSLALFLGVGSRNFAQNALPTPRIEMVLLEQDNKDKEEIAPTDMLKKFFAGVKSGKLDDAFTGLIRDSLLAHKAEDIETLKKGMQQALDKYGDIDGFEILEKKTVGENLLRITCISLGEDMPLRWKFYFYKTRDEWRLLDMRVDNGIANLFEDVGSNK